MTGPLEGIKVLELSRTLAGPFCSMQLADMGAEVIKVEQPGSGDETRKFTPPEVNGEATYYMSLNRNKKGITVNLKTEEGQQIIKDLVKDSDILVENFKTGTMESFGLDYDTLKKINPRLIYCAVSGFGRTGPMRNEPAYDILMQGFGGLMSVTGEKDREPAKAGFSIVDLSTGLYATIAILLALYSREQTGNGQYVEASLLESVISLSSYLGQSTLVTGEAPQRYGSAHPSLMPYQAFETKDSYITIAVTNDKSWRKMCDAFGLFEIKDHPKYAKNTDRVENRLELEQIITSYTKTQLSSEIIENLKTVGVPCGPINDLTEVLSHPQVKARNMVEEVSHPLIGDFKMLGIPIKLNETPGAINKSAPLLGENTEEILSMIGYKASDIAKLKENGVL